MSNFLVPTPDFRSPAAAADLSGMRDDLVYSAVCFGDAASGSINAFAQGQGGAIQSSGTMTNQQSHQKTFTLTTTNLSQSGVVGSNIGDIGIREIGITIEQAYYTNAVATGPTASTYGATQREVAEILNKVSYQLNLINKPMQQGPVFAFPAVGGAYGSVAIGMYGQAGASSSLASVGNNGPGGRPRRLEVVLVVSRIDTIQAQFTVAGGDTLSFTGAAQPTLLWNVFLCNVAADLVG